MKQRKQSGKKMLIRLFVVMVAVTLICFAVCGAYALVSAQRELRYCNEAALDVFSAGLNFLAEDLEGFIGNAFSDESVFSLLSARSLNITVEQRMMAEMNIRQLTRNRTTASTGIFLFRTDDAFRYYSMGDAFLGEQPRRDISDVMTRIRAFWEGQDASALGRWTVYTDAGEVLLVNAMRRNDLFICVMIDLNAYTRAYSNPSEDSASIEYVFFDWDRILTNLDAVERTGLTREDLALVIGTGSRGGNRSVLLHARPMGRLGVGLCSMITLSGIWVSLRVYIILLVLALLLITAIFVFIYHFMNRMLIYPMDEISEASRRIAAGATDIGPEEEPIQELSAIHEALRGLVEQKVSLERENISEAYQKEHALLQYYQLQTRSHFFLNCLKSIFNMASRGERETTLRIITLFSNHLRYVFQDSLSRVPVRAEMAEVEDYFHIIELERSDHILLVKNIDPLLMDYPIPPLVVQTFLENFNKHNAQSSRILRFSVQIDRVTMEDRDYVRLRLSDNGVGYDKEALKTMGRGDGEVFPRYHVGIQNLCRRMDILYHGQHQVAFYNNPGGGACSVIYLPYEDGTEAAPPAGPEAKGAQPCM